MYLIPLVQDRCFRITAHSGCSTLMDPQSGTTGVVVGGHILATGRFNHLGSVIGHILSHLVLIVLQLHIENSDRHAPLVCLVKVQPHAVIVVWKHFTEAGKAECLLSACLYKLFQLLSDREFTNTQCPTLTACPPLLMEPSNVVPLVITEVHIAWHVDGSRTAAKVVLVIKAFKSSSGSHTEMVVHQVAAQLPGVVPQSVREPV